MRIGRLMSVAFLLTLACATGSAAQPGAGKVATVSTDSAARVDSLRREARYAEAAEIARDLLARSRSDSTAKPYQIIDAEWLVRTLEFAAGLPESTQAELVEADRLGDQSKLLFAQKNYTSALAETRRQLELRRRALGAENPEVAASVKNIAVLLFQKGDPAGAEPFFREALAMRRKLLGDEHPHVADVLNNLASVRMTMGDFAGAEPLYREALAIRRKVLGDAHPDVPRSLNNLAVALQRRGDYTGAEPLYREALAIRRKSLGEEHPDVAASLSNLALVLRAKGDYAGAEPLCREALAINRKVLGDNDPALTVSLIGLANFLSERGDYAGAEALHREALAMHRRLLGEENLDVAMELNNLGLLVQAKGDYAAAEPLLREALALRRKLLGDQHPEVATSLGNLAVLFMAEGDCASAETPLRESLAMRRKLLGEEHPDVATDLNYLGIILLDKGEDAGAESLFREALAMERKLLGEDHPYVAVSLCWLANLLAGRQDYTGAEPLLRQALAIRRKVLGPEHPDLAECLWQLAGLRAKRGDYADAETLLVEASRVYDAARLRVGTGIERSSFQKSPYPALAAVRLKRGEPDEAWPAAERTLARSLADLLFASQRRDLDRVEAAREDSLQRALTNLEEQLTAYADAALNDSTGEASQRVTMAQNQLLAIQAQWSAWTQEMASKHPITEGQAFDLARVQRALEPDEAFIGWLDVMWAPEAKSGENSEAWAYVIRKNGPVVWEALTFGDGKNQSTGDLRQPESATAKADSPTLADRYRMALTDTSEVHRAGRRYATVGHELYAERIARLSPHLSGVKDLIVLPSEEMLGIPIESLPLDDGRPLGVGFAVSYAPSATIFTWLREQKRDQQSQDGSTAMLLVGDPPFSEGQKKDMDEEQRPSSGWSLASIPDSVLMRSAVSGNSEALRKIPRLPATRGEVLGLSALSSQPTVLLGPDASEQRLTALADAGELRRFRIIHLATHAWINPERPEESSLLLSQVDLPDPLAAAETGERIYDGRITVKEILQEWKLDADLVTLSGCQTALGRRIAGEGYIGFANGFLQAGARSLLVSLWPVADQATSLLMQRFYENLLGGVGEGTAPARRTAMTKREALREAKAWLRSYRAEDGTQPYSHPFYWASFVLVGDPE
jgi:CHAT domain-containing protein/Tfp pilus assembly protein PilF